MLHLRIEQNEITYLAGYGFRQSVTRYAGEYWDKTASELLCGIADFTQDAGIVMTASEENAQLSIVSSNTDRWLPTSAPKRSGKSVWNLSPAGWLFVPSCREAVEDVMAWTMPYLRGDEATKGCRSTVFPNYTAFREILDSSDWTTSDRELIDVVKRLCLDEALFEMTWSWANWTLHPRALNLQHLLKLSDQIAMRINAVNTD